ncbi:MAG: DUF1592 domain-containing protein [Vicinamibacterales bacterium]
MRPVLSATAFVALLAGTAAFAAGPRALPGPAAPPAAAASQQALVDRYCVTCHNARQKAAGLLLDQAPLARLAEHTETWEKVVRKLRVGAMPPAGMPRPDDAALTGLTSWLETSLDAEAAKAPNPGRPAVHRLNRAEYANAIRDLLGVEIDAPALLPADTSGFGFDNVADVLSVSSGLLERYMAAARKISRLALGDPTVKPGLQAYSLPYMVLLQDGRMSEDLPFGSRGGTTVRHLFPVDGEYSVKVTLQRSYLDTEPRGLSTAEQVDIRLDGERLALLPVGGPDAVGPSPYASAPKPPADEKLVVRFAAKAGPHAISVSFQNRTWAPEGPGPSRFPAASFGTQHAKATSVSTGRVEMAVDTVFVEGPFNALRPAMTESRRRIFVCDPSVREEACARTILGRLARRAYRRAATAEDVDTLMTFYRAGRADGTVDAGIQRALERVLVSPYFLFRVEEDPPGVRPGAAYRISDVDLASRLSFFLWSSIPDDRLLDLAVAGRLKDPAVLEQQVRRMLADPKSKSFVQNFFSQWLYTRNMRLHRPDQKAFMDFDENLREAFITETEMYVESQVRDDRGVMELITGTYTFVNERLARHYGVPNVYGPRFRRVTFTDDHRGGILGQGSLLTVTSMSTRTSPVKRGAWLLEHLLGTPPPPPPPNVPALPESTDGKKVATSVRERMEQHRKNPVCASCHSKMDPLGFALENFDGVGQWRDRDGESVVDASGTLPDGTKFGSPAEFRTALLRRPEALVSTVTTKLLTYAMGRGVEAADMPAVRRIMRDAAASEYRWSTLILGVVRSMPFQMRRAG